MNPNLLPFPVECENANSKFDSRSLVRILIGLVSFFISFALFVCLLSIQTNENIFASIAIAAISIPIIFFFTIWISSQLIIKCFPPNKIYRISNDSIEIRDRKLNELKIFPNQNILSLDSTDDELIVRMPGCNFKLPKSVNPIGSGIKLIVLPFSAHVGVTSLRLHRVILINEKIYIEKFWTTDIKSSKYPNL